jgi:hypothetical protein
MPAMLPPFCHIFNGLLIKLADNRKAAEYAARIVSEYFDLPENVRNEVLIKLAGIESASMQMTEVIAENFSRLPENIRRNINQAS